MSPADIALFYMEHGWNVEPLLSSGRPAMSDLHGRKPSRRNLTEGELADAFCEARGIGIVMPRNVIGIDVDDYGDKTGATDLRALEEGVAALPELGVTETPGLGKLPPTWRSTARGASQPSGIRFYRVPDGLGWREDPSLDIELIWWGHRYARVWPTRKRDKGVNAEYTWHPDPPLAREIPCVDWLPELPEAWVKHFSYEGVKETGSHESFTGDIASLAVAGHWCASVQLAYSQASWTIRRPGLPSYHDAIYPFAMDLGRRIAARCPGAYEAAERLLRECEPWEEHGFRTDTEMTIRCGIAAEQTDQTGCPICTLRAWKGATCATS